MVTAALECSTIEMEVAMWHLIASIIKISQSVRTCPKCGNRQIETSTKKNKNVKCRDCGADIPPNNEGF
ncbi:MAG: hypothetical protein EHM37_10395 [Deltaproteobacteria bacterium]|nr:MAG: hypothetical protein EHM37_10395 [Deltaproteobacteria bacterium]